MSNKQKIYSDLIDIFAKKIRTNKRKSNIIFAIFPPDIIPIIMLYINRLSDIATLVRLSKASYTEFSIILKTIFIDRIYHTAAWKNVLKESKSQRKKSKALSENNIPTEPNPLGIFGSLSINEMFYFLQRFFVYPKTSTTDDGNMNFADYPAKSAYNMIRDNITYVLGDTMVYKIKEAEGSDSMAHNDMSFICIVSGTPTEYTPTYNRVEYYENIIISSSSGGMRINLSHINLVPWNFHNKKRLALVDRNTNEPLSFFPGIECFLRAIRADDCNECKTGYHTMGKNSATLVMNEEKIVHACIVRIIFTFI